MKHLFLTSDACSVAHDIPNHLDLSKGNKLVFIDTAAEPEKRGDITWLENDRQALVDAGFDVTDYTITGKSPGELRNYLPQFDQIYLSGGSTAHLLDQSNKTGFIDFVKELVGKMGKTYIGTSAGSIIAGPVLPKYLEYEKYPEVVDKKAYEFVNFIVVPHWGSENFRKRHLEERVEKMYTESGSPFILLTNNQYVHVKDDYCQIIEVGIKV